MNLTEPSPSRSRPWLLATILVVASCAGPQDATVSVPARPNIVLITLDTLRADRLGYHGYPRDTSPEIDRFAAEAMVFDNALSPMSETLPTHLSILTSQHPLSLGIVNNFQVYESDPEVPTLGELLSPLGYSTGAFISATPLKSRTGIDAGFDVFDQPKARQRVAQRTIDNALTFLAERDENPFFLWVHLYDPHTPRKPPGDFASLYQDDEATIADYLSERRFSPEFPYLVEINRRYDTEVRYTSHQVGRLLDYLKQEDLWDETAIVLTADHGEALGQHDFVGHGKVQQEQIHVPLILSLPGRRDLVGRRSDRLASSLDILPTLIDNLGLAIDPATRSRMSGIDLLTGPSEARALLSARTPNLPDKGVAGGQVRALTTERWKYFSIEEGEDELYDLSVDPFELDNVIGDHPDVAAEMRRKLSETLRATLRSPHKKPPESVDPELRKQLEALGYVDG